MTKPPDIICEIGLNHMGDPKYANRYLAALLPLRPFGITFMFREPEYYATRPGLTLPDRYYRQAARRIRRAGVKLGFSVSDPTRLALTKTLRADFYKLLSKDLTDPKLTVPLLKTGKLIYVSTGLADLKEIGSFLKRAKRYRVPIVLNQTQLTFDIGDSNLKAIETLRRKFKLPVSFGLHSENPNVLYAALSFAPAAMLFYVKGDRPITHKDERNAVPLSACATIFTNLKELSLAVGSGTKVKMHDQLHANKK